MTISLIPLEQDPYKSYRVTLDGESYDVVVQYNQRLINQTSTNKNFLPESADSFTISVALTGSDPILKTSLKTNRDILGPYKYREGCPQGTLILRDTAADANLVDGKLYAPERVSYEGIGTRFLLLYESEE
ncbi:hypothetical protein VPIG_00202 [Vibrio phage PWH3a-P1]|uniref:hypothetical protein n=1 Tax=Vibrio phage PWH3a-P1 TaxID=754058 RepID=UPI0002C0A78F|nr:hypothetical protein VPIG_00202 [Vibrio phage PWH3a-P1]AGH32058.1 hypothetical protein VPIG_00202 [Vibrio phage PWH3a-P1]